MLKVREQPPAAGGAEQDLPLVAFTVTVRVGATPVAAPLIVKANSTDCPLAEGAGTPLLPRPCAGDQIALAARLMAVADVYDALISDRIYRPAVPYPKVIAMMREGRGTQFDPDVLDAFLSIQGEIQAIRRM